RRQRAFWVVWSGQSVSVLGNAIYGIAILIWAATLHASVGDVVGVLAGLGLFLSLPRLLLGPFLAGAVDRFSRKWLMAALDGLRGVVITGIWLLLAAGRLQVWQVFAAAFVDALCAAMHEPAFEASVANLVPAPLLARANGLAQSSLSAANVVGPLAGGVLVAAIGLPALVALDALSFWIAAASLLLVSIPQQRIVMTPSQVGVTRIGAAWRRVWADAVVGFRFLGERRPLLLLLALFALSNLVGGPVQTLLPLLVVGPLGGNAQTLGVVTAAAEAGVLVTGLLISVGVLHFRRHVVGVGLGIGIGGLGALMTGICAGLRTLTGTAASVAVDAGAIPISGANQLAIWQRHVPDELRGRVFAARRAIGQGTYPLGIVLAAPAAAHFDPVGVVIACGAIATAIGALGLWLPALRALDDPYMACATQTSQT
ncbi:MAG TPA: MFS transporter, partial [Ktedonobacterales bacterium]|nr:MFS transporter [Ktedonobacterales bacterium]